MALRIDKGFQQHHAVPESFFPIPGQTPLTERENARPQVEEVPVRKNQEAAVVDYQLQAAVVLAQGPTNPAIAHGALQDRKSTRLNSSHLGISYAVFCLKKKAYTNGT